ncbi:MAG TPA: hypothetical protein VEV38_04165, partial [Candidatus Eremiobacteraceae bacterium]|nr:hypothetical protein [Candidatus Eremiobacteraceae bacterium]
LLQVLERFTDRLIERQRQMYAAEGPFIEKWRHAMAFLEDDASSGYSKVWYELQALGWNDPSIRKRVAQVFLTWRRVVADAFEKAYDEYGIDRKRYPLDAIVALVGTFNEGMVLEILLGIRQGHRALLDLIDGWLVSVSSRPSEARRRPSVGLLQPDQQQKRRKR